MLERLAAHGGLVGLVAVYYLGFLTVGFTTGNRQVVFYAAIMALLFVAIAWWDRRRRFSKLVLWGLAAWGALHMAGGMVPVSGGRVLYNLWLLPFLRFDHLVHALGFGFAGLAFRESVLDGVDGIVSSGAGLVMMGGLGFGALNEMVEFLITRVVPDTNIGEFENAGWDLVANAAGAALAAWWVRWRWSRQRISIATLAVKDQLR
ncbi:MAG TPA: hypothetical protein VLA54_05595 [Acidimicrobiia bacterium]|nr:hypothetical protein [Acidimicrobiia bacterium]